MLRNTYLLRAALVALVLNWAPPLEAAQVNITAEYRKGAEFTNTTPQAAFCGRWPHYCNGVETVGLPITYEKKTINEAPEPRDNFYISLPPRRSVTVTHQGTGETYTLTFEMYAVSQYVVNVEGGGPPPVHTLYVRGGCSYLFTLSGGNWSSYLWSVRTPANPTGCYPIGSPGGVGAQRLVRTSDFGVAYRLVMPSPLKMKQGVYRGHLDYTVGPGMDFDFGNDVSNLSDDSLTVNFELDVVHAFVMDFPDGSDRVVLEPPGGWTQWLNHQRPPERLYRDLPLRIWSSGPFTAHTRCEYPMGGRCAIRNQANDHLVPLQVALTLPTVIQHNGQPVNRLPLPVGEAEAIQLEAMEPAINRGASLHFQVDKAAVAEMTRFPGARYEGDVTIVFDANF
ncbi:hypothetical protein [Pseudomonas japonica]|uniref:CblD like pilus biogenesis initiator n=1 Tax=Pseudomonas japonica TaxID=256466 RepID=A0A239I2W5_9PSED|nr:hypothetical protein [Pseudomonas japonica]SNS87282.1 hypothetical protein SAMN05444352_11754 [Pseudomonas japonica]SNS87403.1 hypothetical protein SAMN05444352_11760 [Pseudomonas japonica]